MALFYSGMKLPQTADLRSASLSFIPSFIHVLYLPTPFGVEFQGQGPIPKSIGWRAGRHPGQVARANAELTSFQIHHVY